MSSVSALRRAQAWRSSGILGDEVQRVGVEHARQVARQRGADQRLGALALAEARTDDQRIEVLAEGIVGMAQHQLRVVWRSSDKPFLEQADIDAAGAHLQRGAAGEQGGAGHAGGPAEDRQRAGHAFVEVARPRLEQVAEQLRLRDPGARRQQLCDREVQVGDHDLAAMVRSVEREKPRLERDERHGMRGAHRAAQHAAGIGVQAARDVERKYRAALAVRILDERRVPAGDVAREADAEQAVDEQRPGLLRHLRHFGNHVDAEKLFPQPRGDHASVAAVVARAGEHEDVLALVPGQARGDLGGGGAGAFHERRLGFAGGALDAPDVVAQVDRTMHASIVRERLLPQLPPMPPLRSLRAFPRALANWAGLAGQDERPVARILMYHGTPRREAAALERELRWLKRRFHIVPLRAIVAAATNGGTLGSKVALTFDDGLRSNVEVAYPLLHRLAIPATFFVCPGLVDRARWLWTHEMRRRLSRLSPAARRELAQEWQAPEGITEFVRWMKKLDSAPRQRILARVRDATADFTPTAAEREAFDLADWKELRRLDPAIVTIGSHTSTHPILPRDAAGGARERSARQPAPARAQPGASGRYLRLSERRPGSGFGRLCTQALSRGGDHGQRLDCARRGRASPAEAGRPVERPEARSPDLRLEQGSLAQLGGAMLRPAEQHGIDAESPGAVDDRLAVVGKKAVSPPARRRLRPRRGTSRAADSPSARRPGTTG